jgi:hydroxypyruvate isomerase
MTEQLQPITRRTALGILGAAAGVCALPSADANFAASVGRLKQSVCRWPYAATPLPELCRHLKQMGFSAIDLLYADEWPVARDAGLTVSMSRS